MCRRLPATNNFVDKKWTGGNREEWDKVEL